MKFPLTTYKPKPKPKTKDPWLLETVENGLRATNIREFTGMIKVNRGIPVQYFEDDRIYGHGAFDCALKVLDMFDELRDITPRTRGFIFGSHKYLYHGKGILKEHIETGRESFFSNETLMNENISCYLNLIYSQEEEKLLSIIQELEDATTTESSQENRDRKRISG